jgi:hypothetical protein
MWTLTMVAGIVLAFPLNFILVPWAEYNFGNGAIGAALRCLCAEFLMAAFAVWMLPSGTLTRENASVALRVFIAGGVMAGACSFFTGMFIAIPVLVGMVTYTLMILVLRVLRPEDMELILNATRGALAGLRIPLPSGRRRD